MQTGRTSLLRLCTIQPIRCAAAELYTQCPSSRRAAATVTVASLLCTQRMCSSSSTPSKTGRTTADASDLLRRWMKPSTKSTAQRLETQSTIPAKQPKPTPIQVEDLFDGDGSAVRESDSRSTDALPIADSVVSEELFFGAHGADAGAPLPDWSTEMPSMDDFVAELSVPPSSFVISNPEDDVPDVDVSSDMLSSLKAGPSSQVSESVGFNEEDKELDTDTDFLRDETAVEELLELRNEATDDGIHRAEGFRFFHNVSSNSDTRGAANTNAFDDNAVKAADLEGLGEELSSTERRS